jgi:hypothetical protein
MKDLDDVPLGSLILQMIQLLGGLFALAAALSLRPAPVDSMLFNRTFWDDGDVLYLRCPVQ